MSDHRGMKWWKCDLQMQTPFSPHWRDPDTKISPADPPERIAEIARAYLHRCHEAGLQVIGITDHNFAEEHAKSFIHHLHQHNGPVATERKSKNLFILPGFEIEAHVGKGAHVLALFDQNIQLSIVDGKLSQLGLIPHNRYNQNGPVATKVDLPEIISVIQKDPECPGVVIAAHSTETKGIFDNDRISDWLQIAEYTNAELLALEVPKPPTQMSQGWRRLLKNGDDCTPDWRRIRRIACVLSSDCYRLTSDPENPGNHIGYRHTWIKMSEPCISALRQAFLDPDTRIAYGDESPDMLRRHPRLQSLKIENVEYLQNQDLDFAPGLNCVIGGRGTGKSTLLEYLRLSLGQTGSGKETESVRKQVGRVKQTLSSTSLLRAEWEQAPTVSDTFEYNGATKSTAIISRTVTDEASVCEKLGVRIFSQKEINDAGSQETILSVVDGLIAADLERSIEEALASAGEVSILLEAIKAQMDSEGIITALKQDAEEISRQLQAWSSIAEEVRRYKEAELAEIFIVSERDRAKELEDEIRQFAARLGQAPSEDEENPAQLSPDFAAVKKDVLEAYATAAKKIEAVADELSQHLTGAFVEGEAAVRIAQEIPRAKDAFDKACAEKEISPQDAGRIQDLNRQLGEKQSDIERKSRDLDTLKRKTSGFQDCYQKFLGIWVDQTAIRRRVLESIVSEVNRSAADVMGQSRLLDFEVAYQASEADFFASFWNIEPDGRTSLGRNWAELGSLLFTGFCAQSALLSVWDYIDGWMDGNELPGGEKFSDLRGDLATHLRVEEVDRWRALKLVRIADKVDFTLYRKDAAGGVAEAGKLSDGKLSDGQRNTIVLTLLLADGEGPIIIDQPEDDIDSDFIFHHLVPVLRCRKDHRQIILVTHNANIVVNGDSDLVYALEFRDGKGRAKAVGGLDRPVVHAAVMDIMEGSIEAFRKRREKYGF